MTQSQCGRPRRLVTQLNLTRFSGLALALVIVASGGTANGQSDRGQSDRGQADRGQADRPAAGQTRQERRDQAASRRQTLGRGMLGLRLGENERDKVFVRDVFRGGPADNAGVRPGDYILAINGDEIGSLDEAADCLRRRNADESVELIVERQGRTREIDVPLAGKWAEPAGAIAGGVERLGTGIGEAATELGEDVAQLSQKMQRATAAGPAARPRASVRDQYDRFSSDTEGDQTDIDDETSDYSGEPVAVIEIDVIEPGQTDFADSAAGSNEQTDRARRDNRGNERNDGNADTSYGNRSAERASFSQGDRRTARALARRAGEPSTRPWQPHPHDHAGLGITVGRGRGSGVTVAGIFPGGPADEAGMQPGDRIVRLNGHITRDKAELTEFLDRLEPGTEIEVLAERHGERQPFYVLLGEREHIPRAPAHPTASVPAADSSSGRPAADSRRPDIRDFE